MIHESLDALLVDVTLPAVEFITGAHLGVLLFFVERQKLVDVFENPPPVGVKTKPWKRNFGGLGRLRSLSFLFHGFNNALAVVRVNRHDHALFFARVLQPRHRGCAQQPQ